MNLYTKFEVSILNGCGDIFDEKSGEKEKKTNIGKNKQEKAHFQSHDITRLSSTPSQKIRAKIRAIFPKI